MDFQNRVGGKTGGGGAASAQQEAVDRKERLRKLAMETMDIAKDPYLLRNHVGQIECKLCLTVHPNEANYMVHTQAKRHQANLGEARGGGGGVRGVAAAAAAGGGGRKAPGRAHWAAGLPGGKAAGRGHGRALSYL